MAIVVRTSGLTAAKQGARAIVTAAGDLIGFVGGGCVRRAVITAGRAAIAEGRPRLIRTVPNDVLAADSAVEDIEAFASFCPSRGEMDFFIEPVLPPPPLVVFGSGEIARCVLALGPVGNLTALRCAGAGSAATVGTREVAAADLAGLPTLASGFIVVATQGAGDRAALQAALATPCPHILFVASRAKAKNSAVKAGGTWRQRHRPRPTEFTGRPRYRRLRAWRGRHFDPC